MDIVVVVVEGIRGSSSETEASGTASNESGGLHRQRVRAAAAPQEDQ